VGVCTDTVFSHIAFQKSLGGLQFPLATDRWPYAKTAADYGIFPPTKHEIPFVNDRAVFIVDTQGKIAWMKIYELRQLPDNAEILEALKKLTASH
jgi:alkyl hydroperoxide reductase subunit AhpC